MGMGMGMMAGEMMDPTMGMGSSGSGMMLSQSHPSIESLRAVVEAVRAEVAVNEAVARPLAKQFGEATDRRSQETLRERLRNTAHSLVMAENNLQTAELDLIQAKLHQLALQLQHRKKRISELTEDRINQWLNP